MTMNHEFLVFAKQKFSCSVDDDDYGGSTFLLIANCLKLLGETHKQILAVSKCYWLGLTKNHEVFSAFLMTFYGEDSYVQSGSL